MPENKTRSKDIEAKKDKTRENLPDIVKEKLPPHAQEIYLKAHDNALEQYQNPAERRGGASESLEEVAHKVAWAAVKKEYEKDEKTGKWVRKQGEGKE